MAEIERGNLTANGNVDVTWKTMREDTNNVGSVFITGTFGGGKATVQASADGGTTFTTLQDTTGADMAYTSAKVANFFLNAGGDPVSGRQVIVRVSLSGSTSPDLDVVVFDAR